MRPIDADQLLRYAIRDDDGHAFVEVDDIDDAPTIPLVDPGEMIVRYQKELCHGLGCFGCTMCTETGGCRVEKWLDTYRASWEEDA